MNFGHPNNDYTKSVLYSENSPNVSLQVELYKTNSGAIIPITGRSLGIISFLPT